MRCLDHLCMPAVHAVEIAERYGGPAGIGGEIPPVMEDANHERDGT
jgi:hypothetical protein